MERTKRAGRSTRLQRLDAEESGPSKARPKEPPTIAPTKVELPTKPEPPVIALPVAVVGDECRRSSRKKNLKFDVRDLLLKSRRSHKIQIEARIDSNAPPTTSSGATTSNAASGGATEAASNKKKTFYEKSAIFRRFSISEQQNKVIPPLRPPPPLAATSKISLLTAAAVGDSAAADAGKAQLRPLNRTQEFFKGSMLKSKQNSSLIVAQMESSTGSVATKSLPPVPAPALPAMSPKVTRSRRKEIAAPPLTTEVTTAGKTPPESEQEGSTSPKRSRVRGRPSKYKTTDTPVAETTAKKRVTETAEKKSTTVTRSLLTKEAEKVLPEPSRSVKTQRKAKDTSQVTNDEKNAKNQNEASQCTSRDFDKETAITSVEIQDISVRETTSEERFGDNSQRETASQERFGEKSTLVLEDKKPQLTIQESSVGDQASQHGAQHGSQGSFEESSASQDLTQDTTKHKHTTLEDSLAQKDSSPNTTADTIVENTSNTSLTFACVTMLASPSRMLNSSVEIQEIDIAALAESPKKKAQEAATTMKETIDEILEISSSSSADTTADTQERKRVQPLAEPTNTMFSAISWFSPSAHLNDESSILVDIVEQRPEAFEFDPMPIGCRGGSRRGSPATQKRNAMTYSYGEVVETTDAKSTLSASLNSTVTESSATSEASCEIVKAKQDAVIIDEDDTLVEIADEQPGTSATKDEPTTVAEIERAQVVEEVAAETNTPAKQAEGDNSKGRKTDVITDPANVVVEEAQKVCTAPGFVVESAEEKALDSKSTISAQPSRFYRTRRSKTISHAAFEEFADRNMASSSKRSTNPRAKEKTPEQPEAEKPAPTNTAVDAIEPTTESPLPDEKTLADAASVVVVQSPESPQKDATAKEKVEVAKKDADAREEVVEQKTVSPTVSPMPHKQADVSDILTSESTLTARDIPPSEVTLKKTDLVDIAADSSQSSDLSSELSELSKDVAEKAGKTRRSRRATKPRTDSPSESRPKRSLTPAKAPDFFVKFDSKRKSRRTLTETVVGSETAVKDEEAVRAQDAGTQAQVAKTKQLEIEVTEEKAVELQVAEEKSVGVQVAEEKSVGAHVAEEKPVGVQVAEEKPVGVQVAEEKSVGVQVAEEKSVGAQVAEEKPVVVQVAEEKSVGVQIAEEKKPVEVQVVKEQPVEVQNAESATANDKSDKAEDAQAKARVATEKAETKSPVDTEKLVEDQGAGPGRQTQKQKSVKAVDCDVLARLTAAVESDVPKKLERKPETSKGQSFSLELDPKSKTPEQATEIKNTMESEQLTAVSERHSNVLAFISMASELSVENTLSLSNKNEPELDRPLTSTSDSISHKKEAVEATFSDSTKKEAELTKFVTESVTSSPKKLSRTRSTYQRSPPRDYAKGGRSACQEKPLEAEEQKKRRRDEDSHVQPPLPKTKKSKWDVRVRQSPERSEQKQLEKKSKKPRSPELSETAPKNPAKKMEVPTEIRAEKKSKKPRSPELSETAPKNPAKKMEVPTEIREGLDKSDRTYKKSRREAKRREEDERRTTKTDSEAKHKSERDEPVIKPIKSPAEVKHKSESFDRADLSERKSQKLRFETPTQRESKKAQRLPGEVKTEGDAVDARDCKSKKSRKLSIDSKTRTSDTDWVESFVRNFQKSQKECKNNRDDVSDKNSQKQPSIAKNPDESPVCGEALERKQQKSSKAQATDEAAPKTFEKNRSETKTAEPIDKAQKTHTASKSHAQPTDTPEHTSEAEDLNSMEHKFLEEEAEHLSKSTDEKKAARKSRLHKMQKLFAEALEMNPQQSSKSASEISTTPPPKSGSTQVLPKTSTPLAKVECTEKEKSNEKSAQPNEQEFADPLKDIEKFIEDGEILLKRDFTIDEDTVDEFTAKTVLPAEDVEDSTDAFKEEDMSSMSGMTDVMFESDDVYLDAQQLNPYETPADTPIDTPSSTPRPDSASFYVNYDDEDNTGVRRSSRLKQNSRSTKLLVGRGLVEGKSSFSLDELAVTEASNAKFLKDMGDRLSNFHVIKENIYKTERIVSKEQMSCDCFLTAEEEERGELGCGDDCLNRLLMIECGPECNVKNRCTNIRIQKHFCSPCLAFRTEKKGIGLMANAIIEPGEFIMEYVGEVIDGTEFERRRTLYSQDKNRHYYFMSLRSDAIIDATVKGNISRFINHSCDPNAETQKWTVNGELRIGFFSRKTIMAGEEITFDYQYQRYGREAQRCYCEASNCRGWIGEEPDSDESEQLDDSDEETPNLASLMLEEDEDSDSPIDDVEEAKKTLEAAAAQADLTSIEPLEASDPRLREGVDSIERVKHLLRQIAEKEVQKKQKKKTTRHVDTQWKSRFLGDPDIDDELDYFNRYGARSKDDLLVLSRLMVRVKSREIRKNLLSIVIKADKSIQKLFMDYHGFKLLYGWMNEDGDDLEMRKTILDVLEALPITNKNGLLESKVFETLEGWCGTATVMRKEPTSSSEESSQESMHQGDATSVEAQIEKRAAKLRAAFDNLPLFDRIPKRVRIEQMKEHEREVDRQYEAALEDDSNKSLRSDRYRRDRSGRERHRSQPARRYDPDYDYHLSKEERREKFERKVRRDEEEKRQSENRREFEVKCRFFYLDPATTRNDDLPFCVNPNSGQWYAHDGHPIPTPPSHLNVPLPEMPTDPQEYDIKPELIDDLPPNWTYAIAPTGGFIYYYHIKDRVPQWDKPTLDEDTDSSDVESNPDEQLCERLCNMTEEELHAYVENEVKNCRAERNKVLIDSRPISPRREEDRIYNQMETRKYKENKEKMRKRKEEIRRRRAEQIKNGAPIGLPGGIKIKIEKDDDAPVQQDPYDLPADALPIAEYLLSSDEEGAPKVGAVEAPSAMHTLDIVEGDKIVDELDALNANIKLKRPLPVKREAPPSTSTETPVEQDKKPEKPEKHRHQSKKHKLEKRKSKDSDSKYRRRKEKFRCEIAGIIVENLKPYLLEKRETGRIRNESDFKHLARKLTHFVMVKEMKYCEAIGQTLVVTESVKNKSREFIRKYMAKYDGDYEIPKNDPEFRDIPIKL